MLFAVLCIDCYSTVPLPLFLFMYTAFAVLTHILVLHIRFMCITLRVLKGVSQQKSTKAVSNSLLRHKSRQRDHRVVRCVGLTLMLQSRACVVCKCSWSGWIMSLRHHRVSSLGSCQSSCLHKELNRPPFGLRVSPPLFKLMVLEIPCTLVIGESTHIHTLTHSVIVFDKE